MYNSDKEQRKIINSKPFRRLADKTQVMPSKTRNAQVRTRLTHSLEVASIAHEIAKNINKIKTKYNSYRISPTVCANASLLHDIGMCGFGHIGEQLLSEVFYDKFNLYFEANANNLGIIDKDLTHISDLTKISIIKYPFLIKENEKGKGLYYAQYKKYHPLLEDIIKIQNGNNPLKRNRTYECDIMEIADDISYLFSDTIDMLSLQKKDFIKKNKILKYLKKYKIFNPIVYTELQKILLDKNIVALELLRDEVISSVVYNEKRNTIEIKNKDFRKLLRVLREITWKYYISEYSILKTDKISRNIKEYFEYLADNITNEKIIISNIFSNTRKKQYKESLNKKGIESAAKILIVALSELSDTYLLSQVNKYNKKGEK